MTYQQASSKSFFRWLVVQCGVFPSSSGNVGVQDSTFFLSALEMPSSSIEKQTEELLSPFANTSAIVRDHRYLPTCFGGFFGIALVYISGFVVWQIIKKLLCDVCCGCLVTDAVPASLDQSHHFLHLKTKEGQWFHLRGIWLLPDQLSFSFASLCQGKLSTCPISTIL